MRKILFFADSHCGNDAGLALPTRDYLSPNTGEIQEEFWKWFDEAITTRGPFDGSFIMGDVVDGEGKKGTLDTYLTNIQRQADCAAEILEYLKIPPDKMWMVRGTPFHTNSVLEYEDLVANRLGCSIQNVQKREIEGWKVHTKHVSGRSDTPYGQATPLLKELDRLEGEAFRESKDAPDVIARAHVHYDCLARKHNRQVFDCPCLELPLDGANSRRYSSQEYDVGITIGYFERGRLPLFESVIMPIRLVKDGGYECVNW